MYDGDMNTTTPAPSVTAHCKRQAAAKGFSPQDVYLAQTQPHITYPSGPKYPGQERRIRGNLVVVCDIARNVAITVYENVRETALRPDQIARGERKAS